MIVLEFLRFLESIRTPFLDKFFSLVTHFGEEMIFIVIGIVIFWCMNKKKGYYILFVGYLGLVINQFLKIAFRIPRPWVKDPSFTIVESARAEATGYSFPSGHTQISVGAYASIAKSTKKVIVRIVCIILCILVPFSRLYLGVHTPLDVLVSVVSALLLTFALYPIVNKALESKKHMRSLMGVMIAFSLVYLVYVQVFPFPLDTDAVNLLDAQENAYKIFGAMAGIWLGYEIDEKYIRFDTKAVWWAQILKVLLGVLPVLLIKEGLEAPLDAAFMGNAMSNAVRYFLITFFACGIWPYTFKFFGKLGAK